MKKFPLNKVQLSKAKKRMLPLAIAVLTIIVVNVIIANPPTSKRSKPSKAPQMTVDVLTIAPQNYQVMIQSFGTVSPRTKSVLYSQVSGQINKVSPKFRSGGFFKQGDTLLELDDRDLHAEVNIARATLVSAKHNLEEEQARVLQAEADWQRLGNGKAASALVLRKPQLEAAKATVLSAQAQLSKAELALERTKIIAPYAGRLLQKHVDLGQVVSSNTALADIYAVDYVEIRLPIKNKDLPLMSLPEEYRNVDELNKYVNHDQTNVVISSDLMGEQVWQGKVVRTESAIDESSQQLYVVAQILKPYEQTSNNGGQIKIGQYVTAQITGNIIEDALVIPSSAIYQGSYVYTVEAGVLKRKNIQLGWQNGLESIVISGLSPHDTLVLTPLGQVNSGTPVAIAGASKKKIKPSTNKNKAKAL